MRIVPLLAAVLAFLGIAAPAQACSVTREYVRPTNFELVQMADAIVVANPERHSASEFDSALTFRTETVVKGPAPERFDVFGAFGRAFPSDPSSIDAANGESYMGPCVRHTFTREGRYVLFLQRRDDGAYYSVGMPFSRVSEDYSGDDSLWMRTIRHYVDLQARLEPMAQLTALEAEFDALRQNAHARDREAPMRDIADHLMSRPPWKPTQYLLSTFEALERGETPRFQLRSRAADREGGAADAFTDFLFGAPQTEFPDVAAQQDFILRSFVLGDHPGAAPLFERLLADPDLSARRLGNSIQYLAQHDQYPRAFALIEARALAALDAAPDEQAFDLIRSIQQAQTNRSYGWDNPRWRDHPEIAARWPDLAQRLWDYQVARFGEDYAYPFPDVNIR